MNKKVLKIFISSIVFLSLLLVSSCGIFKNKYITMEHGVDITVPDEWKEHFLYPNEVPSLHFGYDGINVLEASTKDHYTFVQNDFYAISDAWGMYLKEFKDNYIITKATKQTNETISARLGGEFLPLDEMMEDPNNPGTFIKQESSMEYLMVCFDEDGTRYSCSFRTFVSNGKRYFGYAYTGNLEIKLNMPIMVIKENNEKKLLMLPLPFDTKYTVSNNARLDAILKKDSYLKEDNYIFDYPTTYTKDDYVIEGSKDKKTEWTIEQKQKFIEDWYIKYCHGEYIDGTLYVEYAGARYTVNFDAGKSKEAFSLKYVGKA
jgi:hypothetical protein